jgi:putative RecB family exonuclease
VPTVYSHSRMSSFENCPKQFHFKYVLKIPQETEGIEAFVGKRVHEVLERLYVFVDQDMVPSLDKVIHRYRVMFDEMYDPERVRIVREGIAASFYRELGERCLRNYYHRHYPFDADETLGLEERVLFDLDQEGRYKVQGIIDRIVRARDGTVEVHDYKTGKYVPSQKNLDQDRQLALYQIGLSKHYPGEPMRLVWHFVQSGQIRTSTRTPEELASLRSTTISLIDRIEQETDFAPNKIPLCSWCEYKSLCPAWMPEGEPAREIDRAPAAAAPRAAPRDSDDQLSLL